MYWCCLERPDNLDECFMSGGYYIISSIVSLKTVLYSTEAVEPELLHTYSKVYSFDVVLLIVRFAVLTAVTLTVPVVLFPVSIPAHLQVWKRT